jgi:CheY-like chemotaxis protein
VYGIVSESQGTIGVDSALGAGTKVIVRLPRVACSLPSGQPVVAGPWRGRAGTGGRILLVEDEEEVRAMAAEALEIEGYAVTVASSGEEALEIWRASDEAFQLLLTDVIMPGLSGGELAQRVRRLRPATKVLYMSGYNDDAIVRYGVSVSEADFLQKPFTLESLARKVRGALETAGSSTGTGAS